MFKQNYKIKSLVIFISSIILFITLVSCSPYKVNTVAYDVLEASEESFLPQLQLQAQGDGSCIIIIPKNVVTNFKLFSQRKEAEAREFVKKHGHEYNLTDEDIIQFVEVDEDSLQSDGSAKIELTQEERQKTINNYVSLIKQSLENLMQDAEQNKDDKFNPFVDYELNENLKQVNLIVEESNWINLDASRTNLLALNMIMYQFFRAIPIEEINYQIDFTYEGKSRPFYRYVRK